MIADDDRPLPDQIYAALRERIITGELPPGRRLVERDLAADLGVSRIPLRAALPQLEADGFITTTPRRGAVIAQLTLEDIEELFDVREKLEPMAAELAARRLGAPGVTLDRAEVIMARSEAALSSGDEQAAAAANVAFHRELIALPGHRLLGHLMQPLMGRLEWLFRLTADRDIAAQCAEHRGILTAIRAGNGDVAAALAFAHVASGREPSIGKLRSRLPSLRASGPGGTP
ncbi:GntR family transcriptional regulator [Actinoplanes sp. NPDC023936]|uniref:GntR family transcriptional regulator n=1 Tax=Actinoplanes sp. NPDC023936 TaxID=3154910 RepID=UPI0033CDA7B4